MTTRRLALGLALLLTASACGGPPNPIEAGVKEFPTDVLMGSTATEGPAPITGAVRDEAAPVLIRPVTRVGDSDFVSIEIPPEPCPTADPLGNPAREAFNTPSQGPPAEGRYPFRNSGTYSVSGATTAAGNYGPSNRTVKEIAPRPNGYEFTVGDDLGIDTRYRIVRPPAPTVPDPQDPLGPGLYITRIVSQTADGVDAFTPVQPMKLAAFGLVNNERVTSVGTSPTGSTVMTVEAVVGRPAEGADGNPTRTPKTWVDACGTWLDAWWIHLTGSISGPRKELTFTALLAFAPQYGGLMIQEHWKIEGNDNGNIVASERRSMISTEPKGPQ